MGANLKRAAEFEKRKLCATLLATRHCFLTAPCRSRLGFIRLHFRAFRGSDGTEFVPWARSGLISAHKPTARSADSTIAQGRLFAVATGTTAPSHAWLGFRFFPFPVPFSLSPVPCHLFPMMVSSRASAASRGICFFFWLFSSGFFLLASLSCSLFPSRLTNIPLGTARESV